MTNKFLLAAAATALIGCETLPEPQAAAPAGTAETPAVSADIDPASGMNLDSIVAISTIENKVVVFFVAARADQAQLSAAPAKLCAARGMRLASFEVKNLEHPETMPGVRKLVATCR